MRAGSAVCAAQRTPGARAALVARLAGRRAGRLGAVHQAVPRSHRHDCGRLVGWPGDSKLICLFAAWQRRLDDQHRLRQHLFVTACMASHVDSHLHCQCDLFCLLLPPTHQPSLSLIHQPFCPHRSQVQVAVRHFDAPGRCAACTRHRCMPPPLVYNAPAEFPILSRLALLPLPRAARAGLLPDPELSLATSGVLYQLQALIFMLPFGEAAAGVACMAH